MKEFTRGLLTELLNAGQALGFEIQKELATRVHAIKSIRDVVQGYKDDLTVLFENVLDGDPLASEAKRRHVRFIKRDAEPAYIEGLKDGGVDEPELDDDDNKAIAEWIDTQSESVPGLWDDIQELSDDWDNGKIDRETFVARRRSMYERIGVWGDALNDLAGKGKASALENMMVTWYLGETEVHCRVCNRLDGRRQRLKWFTSRGYYPQEKASETLDCGGWRCECELRDDKGKVILPA